MQYWGNKSDEEDKEFKLLGQSIEYYKILLGALFIFITLILFQNAESTVPK